MEFDDDDLEMLGYGNQWSAIVQKESKRRKSDGQEKLKSVEEYHKKNPGSADRANRNWKKKHPEKQAQYEARVAKRNLERFGFMIGKTCVMCGIGKHTKYSISRGSFHCEECK